MKSFWQFLSEVSKEDLALIPRESNLFSDIFGNKIRIIIPMNDDNDKKFITLLQTLGMEDVDLIKGTGITKVKTEQGTKDREIKIGKFLQDKKEEQWLDWYQKRKSQESGTGLSIIISRSPIDILRMSDHSKFVSCHSSDRGFYQCAVQEAKTGGLVAYLVRNSDLSKIKNIQQEEIFDDPERGINTGLQSLERIRLRRYQDEKTDYLVPTTKTYPGIEGKNYSGLYDTVKDWAKNIQKERLEKVNYYNLKLRGGSYEDSTDISPIIWSKFLGKIFTNKRPNIDKKEEIETFGGMEEWKINQLVRSYIYKNFIIMASSDEGQNIIQFYANVNFDFSNLRINTSWQKYRKKIISLISNEFKWVVNYIDFTDKILHVKVTTKDGFGTLQTLKKFLEQVKIYDENYQNYKSNLEVLLKKAGILY